MLDMKEDLDKPIDELFTKIRLKLLDIRQTDPELVEELKNLLVQLEDYVQSLIIDSMKLQDLKDARKKKRQEKNND